MKKYSIPILLSAVINAGCSVFGVRSEETPKYNVMLKNDHMEIRQYESYIVASTLVNQDFDGSQSSGFRVLADYIFGNNISKQKIAMTSPVVREQQSEKIAMTAPVIMDPTSSESWVMSFSMPSKYKMEDLPEPVDNRVQLKEVKSHYKAALRFTGFWNDEKIKQKGKELLKWLESQTDYTPASEPQFAGYDPPWTLPFLRRNEVFIELKKNQI